MSAPELALAYPLRWPEGRPRSSRHKPSAFRHDGRNITWTVARRRLVEQITRITPTGSPWRVTDQVLSTNIRFTLAGYRDQNVSRRDPDDPGVAFYFALDGRPHVLACDRWDTVYDNVAAIAAHIDALRGQERWGVADLSQAFAGHVALPAPGAAAPRPWWRVLGLPDDRVTLRDVDAVYRRLAAEHHPDRGCDPARMAELNAARDQAREALS
jgi:hypothetical protein